MGERNDLIERLLNPLWAHMRGGEPHLDDEATLADLKEAATTIASLSKALAEAEKKGAEDEDAKKAERHRIFRLLWDQSEHVNAYSLGLLVQDDASVVEALPPRDLSQGGQHG